MTNHLMQFPNEMPVAPDTQERRILGAYYNHEAMVSGGKIELPYVIVSGRHSINPYEVYDADNRYFGGFPSMDAAEMACEAMALLHLAHKRRADKSKSAELALSPVPGKMTSTLGARGA